MVEKFNTASEDNLKLLLSKPTNNFGLGSLFKKFILLGEEMQ